MERGVSKVTDTPLDWLILLERYISFTLSYINIIYVIMLDALCLRLGAFILGVVFHAFLCGYPCFQLLGETCCLHLFLVMLHKPLVIGFKDCVARYLAVQCRSPIVEVCLCPLSHVALCKRFIVALHHLGKWCL